MTTSFFLSAAVSVSLTIALSLPKELKDYNIPSPQTASVKKGWKQLFDGKTTKGWHTYGKNQAGAGWVVESGALRLDASNTDKKERGDLVTDQEYENYHFKVEWKVASGSNSGIIFNIKEDASKYPATYHTGPEMQVIDNAGHPDGKIAKHHAGDLYDLISCSTETVKPVGSWNKAEVIVNKGKLDLVLNGVTVVSTMMFDEKWAEMVAGSKFKKMQDFGTFKKGRIALQDHGDAVWYRNIMIKEL
ncbi:MAG: DUF1080 domain-containing protein [Chitinophagaceae bacterium]|nr:DUF1080 domain-containing protein [Chitinophagaceae bacterium]